MEREHGVKDRDLIEAATKELEAQEKLLPRQGGPQRGASIAATRIIAQDTRLAR